MKNIKLATNLSIAAVDYANQGNSIIGIRDSGKTYTATKVAEGLLKAGIPFIAFDPTGVWQNLRSGVDGHSGYQVVVAGGNHGDIHLNDKNAVKIVEVALQQNVSVVFDLRGRETATKAHWQRIVSECIQYLMDNNERFGLRHIFIEEAAEFAPQRVYPGGQLLYSRIESLARMGRNFYLGYTLINQRAEEIAKAVFEISELVLVHRQSGKNSLNSIKNWLHVRGQEDLGIIETLPKLNNGQCWAIDNTREIKIQVLPKETYHPNPKADKPATSFKVASVDVSAFLQQFKADEPAAPTDGSLKTLKAEVISLRRQIAQAQVDRVQYESIFKKIADAANNAAQAINMIISMPIFNGARPVELPEPVAIQSFTAPRQKLVEGEKSGSTTSKPVPAGEPALSGGALRILKAAAMYFPKSISKLRVGSLAALSIRSGTFSTYISFLKKRNYIEAAGADIVATPFGMQIVGDFTPLPSEPDQVINMWCGMVGNDSGMSRMLRHLAQIHPAAISKTELSQAIGMTLTSGSYNSYIAKLKALGLIVANGQQLKIASEIFE